MPEVGKLIVSRETYERLELYAELLRKWNPKINLVSKSTLDDLWSRHIVDSAQIYSLSAQNADHWADLGSGGGFPGLVIAILAAELAPKMKVSLVESDQRKCAFLRTVSRETGVMVDIHAKRIEQIGPLGVDVLSARALAELDALLGFADRHLKKDGICLFPKGLTWKKELEKAYDSWRFSYEAITSETAENAVVLRINEIEHV